MKFYSTTKASILSIFILALMVISCNAEDRESLIEQNSNRNLETTTSERMRPTQDVVNFRTQLSEAVQEGQNGNMEKYEEILVIASIDFLEINMITYDKKGSSSSIFSKALTLYSDKMKQINSPNN